MFTRGFLRPGVLLLGCAAMVMSVSGCGGSGGGGGGFVALGVPTVSSVDPANGRVNVPINTRILVTFSESMDPLTINQNTFTLDNGVAQVAGVVTYQGITAVFTPAANLAINTLFNATITTGAKDLAGNPLTIDFAWSFTTGAVLDTTALTVTSTDPPGGRTGVALNKTIVVTFSEGIDPTTLTATEFTLSNGALAVAGTVTVGGVTAVFNPAANLLANTLYTATITTGVTDLAGNPLASDHVWTWTTGGTPDNTAPSVSSTNPANGAIGVPLNKRISATFSEAMNPLTISTATFTLNDGASSILGTVTYSGVTATFDPANNLDANTTFTATITTAAGDLAGNALANDFNWTFTTGAAVDTTSPTVTSTDPPDRAIGVSVNKKIAATFSEAMNPLTITTATFTLTDGATPILGTVSYAGVTATFTPAGGLAPNTAFTATISTEAADLAGNELAAGNVWTFATGVTPDTTDPTVTSTDPVDGAIGVPINKRVSATFSEVMDPVTISTATFTLNAGLVPVTGTVNYVDDTATFTPSGNLTTNTTYTAMIWMEAADLAGNPLAADHVWTFSTGLTTAQDTIDLGAANAFAILAGSTVTNTGPSIVTGDLGVSPGTAVTGFPPGTVVSGAIFTGAGSAAGPAKAALTAAYNEAAGRSTGAVSLPGNLSGLTLYPGLYTNSTSVMLSAGNVTLDAQGDVNAVFIFQMGSTLTTGSGTQVVLAGGANADNIYWSVGTSATLGTTSIFKGNILAEASITLATGAVLDEGRALTRTAAVTLDGATIARPTP